MEAIGGTMMNMPEMTVFEGIAHTGTNPWGTIACSSCCMWWLLGQASSRLKRCRLHLCTRCWQVLCVSSWRVGHYREQVWWGFFRVPLTDMEVASMMLVIAIMMSDSVCSRSHHSLVVGLIAQFSSQLQDLGCTCGGHSDPSLATIYFRVVVFR